MRTIILGGVMFGLLLACAMLSAMPSAAAREWGYGRSYYPGPFYELYQRPVQHSRWASARVPRPHRVAVPPDGYWGEPVAVYSPWCKQRVLRKDGYFGWVWTTAWAC